MSDASRECTCTSHEHSRFALPPLTLEAYLAPGAGAGAVIAVEVCGKIQLYFGELSTMKWIKNATTTPVPM
jgi:hypothetical protein